MLTPHNMRRTDCFTTIGVWILVAAFLVLPLYELADYSEVWQHDGDVILPGLFFLFSGMVLLTGRRLYRAIRLLIQMLQIAPDAAAPVIIRPRTVANTTAVSPPWRSVAFAFSDLRI